MKYKASLDNLAKIVTLAITLIFATIIVLQITLITDGSNASPIFTTVAILLIYFGTFSFRPMSYTLSDDHLIINRPLANVVINRSEIKYVEQLNSDKLSWTVRTFGVSGLFGYFGKFSNYKIGSMRWYATRRLEKLVLITTVQNFKIVLSPNENEKFIKEFAV